MIIKAYAKVNLSLDVVGKRADGYHLLSSVMQSIDLCDEIIVKKNDSGKIVIQSGHPHLPLGPDNIAYQACQLLKQHYQLDAGFTITIDKRIPIAAGLAGGSSNAAAVLRAVTKLCQLPIDEDTLQAHSLKLGADLPFCLMGGAALAEGIGERLMPLKSMLQYTLVLVKPAQAVATGAVYNALDHNAITQRPNNAGLISAMQMGDFTAATRCMYNVLEPITSQSVADIAIIKRQLLDNGADFVQMSGSGPTVFGLFTSERLARQASENLGRYYPQTHVAKPLNRRNNLGSK